MIHCDTGCCSISCQARFYSFLFSLLLYLLLFSSPILLSPVLSFSKPFGPIGFSYTFNRQSPFHCYSHYDDDIDDDGGADDDDDDDNNM